MNIKKYKLTYDVDMARKYFNLYRQLHPTAKTFLFLKDATKKKLKDKKNNFTLDDVEDSDFDLNLLSLNKILIINNRMTMNGIKEKYGLLSNWLIKQNKELKQRIESEDFIKNCVMEVVNYTDKDNGKDIDNYITKFYLDGMVEAKKITRSTKNGKTTTVKEYFKGIFEDDNYRHIAPILSDIVYDKENPRFEIRITEFYDEPKMNTKKLTLKDKRDRINIHLEQWQD